MSVYPVIRHHIQSEEFDAAQRALADLAVVDRASADTCCVEHLVPQWQEKVSKRLGGAKPKQGAIWDLDKRITVKPPRNDHGTIWKIGRKAVCYTSETYFDFDQALAEATRVYCEKWGLRYSVLPVSLWNPGKTIMISYRPNDIAQFS